VRLQRRLPKPACNSMAGSVHEKFGDLTVVRIATNPMDAGVMF